MSAKDDDASAMTKKGRAAALAKRLAKEVRRSGIALKQRGIPTPFSDARLALKESSYQPRLQGKFEGKLDLWGRNLNGTVYVPPPRAPEPKPSPPANLMKKLDLALNPGPADAPVKHVPAPGPWFGRGVGQPGSLSAASVPEQEGRPGGAAAAAVPRLLLCAVGPAAAAQPSALGQHVSPFASAAAAGNGHPTRLLAMAFPLSLDHRTKWVDVAPDKAEQATLQKMWDESQLTARERTFVTTCGNGGRPPPHSPGHGERDSPRILTLSDSIPAGIPAGGAGLSARECQSGDSCGQAGVHS